VLAGLAEYCYSFEICPNQRNREPHEKREVAKAANGVLQDTYKFRFRIRTISSRSRTYPPG